jgi:Ca2+-binding RTX toxin-like protein
MKSRAIPLLAVMGTALVLSSGVALAVDRNCEPDRKCVGTRKSDTLFGTSTADRIYGLERGDSLIGFGAADRLFVGSGNDELWESDSNDVANGDGADDKLGGGGGSDDYIFADGWGHDTVVDKQIPDNNADTGNQVTFSSSSNNPGTMTINLVSDSGPLPEVTDELGNNTIDWSGNVVDNILNAHTTHDLITGNNRANNITSQNGNDIVHGAGGDDVVNVLDGNVGGIDRVECGEGTDTVNSDPGDELLDCEIQNP